MRTSRLAAPVSALALCLSAVAAPVSAASPSVAALPALVDVPEYRANSARTGVYPGVGPVQQPVLVWSRSIDAGFNFNPILVDGMVLVGGDDHRFYALDARTGAERWHFEAADAIDRFGSAADGTVVFASADGILHALDVATGKEGWSHPGIAFGTDIVDRVVYAPGTDDHAYGIDLATGTTVWSWAAPANVAYISVADGTMYASVADGRLYAIALADGVEQWHIQTLGANPGVTEIDGDTVTVSVEVGDAPAETGELYVIDRASGSVRWRFRTPTGHQITLGATSNGALYTGTLDGSGLYAFPIASDASGAAPQPLWHTPITAAAYKNQALSGDLLYVPTQDPNEILAVGAADGAIRWRVPLAGSPGGALASGGMLFVADDTGVVSAFAEPRLAAAIGPTVSGPLPAPAPSDEPPDPFTILRTLAPATTGLHGLLSFNVGPDGLIYALDSKPSVTVIDPATGEVVRTWGRQGAGLGEFDLGQPVAQGAIDVSPNGTVFVSDSNNHRIQAFSSDGAFIRENGSFGTADGQFRRPLEISSDARDDLYVVEAGRASLTKFDRDGAFVWRALGGSTGYKDLLGTFHSVVARPDGRLELLREGGPVLILDAASGAVLDRWGEPGGATGELGANCVLTIDPAGNDNIFSCGPVFTQVFDPDHNLIAGAYAPRDQVVVPVFGPSGTVYGHSPEFTTDDIYVLRDSLLP